MNLKKSQDIFEFEFYKKYYEIQDSIKDRWYVSNLKKKLSTTKEIMKFLRKLKINQLEITLIRI